MPPSGQTYSSHFFVTLLIERCSTASSWQCDRKHAISEIGNLPNVLALACVIGDYGGT